MAADRKSGRWTWLWVLLLLFMAFTALLSAFGVHLFEKTEKVEIIDKPHQ